MMFNDTYAGEKFKYDTELMMYHDTVRAAHARKLGLPILSPIGKPNVLSRHPHDKPSLIDYEHWEKALEMQRRQGAVLPWDLVGANVHRTRTHNQRECPRDPGPKSLKDTIARQKIAATGVRAEERMPMETCSKGLPQTCMAGEVAVESLLEVEEWTVVRDNPPDIDLDEWEWQESPEMHSEAAVAKGWTETIWSYGRLASRITCGLVGIF